VLQFCTVAMGGGLPVSTVGSLYQCDPSVGRFAHCYSDFMPVAIEVVCSSATWRRDREGLCNTSMLLYQLQYIYSASTVFIQWWLQYKPNSMKMVFSTNGVGSF
jgi:hypothetical protein